MRRKSAITYFWANINQDWNLDSKRSRRLESWAALSSCSADCELWFTLFWFWELDGREDSTYKLARNFCHTCLQHVTVIHCHRWWRIMGNSCYFHNHGEGTTQGPLLPLYWWANPFIPVASQLPLCTWEASSWQCHWEHLNHFLPSSEQFWFNTVVLWILFLKLLRPNPDVSSWARQT